MIQHYWTLIVRKSHIDQDTNALIIGEVLENVQFGLPADMKEQFERDVKSKLAVPLPFEFEMVSFMGTEKPNQDIALEIELVLVNGHVITLGKPKLSSGKTGKFRHRIRSVGLPVCGSGKNLFRVFEIVEEKRHLLAEVPLMVEVNFA